MKKIQSFTEFKATIKESEIMHIKDSNIGEKLSCVLTISRSTRKCLIAKKSDSDSWGTIHGELESASSTISELRNETIRNYRTATGFKEDIELLTSHVHVKDGPAYHNYIALIEAEYMPHMSSDYKIFQWATLEELLDLNPKEEDLVALMKNDKTFFKYLKKL